MNRIKMIILAALALMPLSNFAAQKQEFDLLIKGGKVYDGSGNPWFYADIGISDNTIVAVGKLQNASARQMIDAKGRYVVPGMIDLHAHADEGSQPEAGLRSEDPRRRAAPNIVSQGVTTVVINHDGRSAWPIRQQIAEIRAKGIGPNAILLFGHGEVRQQVMNDDFRRPATVGEIVAMQELARQAMGEGAFGMSAGLEYVPGRWSRTDELIEIMKVVAKYGGMYVSHERSEGADPMWYWPSQDSAGPPTLLDAVMETIEIGEQTGATVVCTHIKSKGAHFWGVGRAAIQLIQRARDRGVDVWADQYPYNTSGPDGNTLLIPFWAYGLASRSSNNAGQAGVNYALTLKSRLRNRSIAEKVRRDIAHEIRRRGGAENMVVFDYPDSSFIGKSLAQLAAQHDLSPVDMALKLQFDGFADRIGGVRLRGFSMSEIDVEAYAAQPWTITASDGGIALPGDGPVHARFYGTFPRKIRRYAIERGIISVSDAIRSMTSLPAQVLGLRDRGMLREGFHADLAIIDLENYADTATFKEPHQYATGVDYVFVNGQMVVEKGMLTWALPGVVIEKK